jgi:hypothetical protein
MTIEGNISLLSAIPGRFVGAAVFFGNPGGHRGDIVLTVVNTAACMLIGSLAGILSAKLPEWFKPREEVATKITRNKDLGAVSRIRPREFPLQI